jgi:hypothetical protein
LNLDAIGALLGGTSLRRKAVVGSDCFFAVKEKIPIRVS